MDVKFTNTTATKLNSLSVTNGQLIALSDSSALYYDLNGTRRPAYVHPNSGVTAGTYRSVTVNAQGHVTAGTNPTLTVAQGGTGATTAAAARTNLGITLANLGAAAASHTHSYAPSAHASTGTGYGVGNASNYGHVKVSDAYTASAGTAANAVAASSYALVSAYNALNSGKLSVTSGSTYSSAGDRTGYYYKFSNGLMICLQGIQVYKYAMTTAWGSMYEGAKISLGNWPCAFVSVPWVSATVACNDTLANVTMDAGALIEGLTKVSATSCGQTYLCRPVSTAAKNYLIDLIAIGWWK